MTAKVVYVSRHLVKCRKERMGMLHQLTLLVGHDISYERNHLQHTIPHMRQKILLVWNISRYFHLTASSDTLECSRRYVKFPTNILHS